MLKWLKQRIGLERPEEKISTEFQVGIENKRIVIKFGQPTLRIELDRLQTLNLVEALTAKIVLTEKAKK